MDRGIPIPGNEEIELYVRTYYSLLRSSGEVQVRSLEETHSGMNASLHQNAESPALDLAAFTYAALRLPRCVFQIRLVLLGQSPDVFTRRGYPNVEQWQAVKTEARRRKIFFDDVETMAVFINSISDIDDLIPLLTTYQIEWNKMHERLVRYGLDEAAEVSAAACQEALAIDDDEFADLRLLWGPDLLPILGYAARHRKRFAVRLLAGSYTDYRRATEEWWANIVERCGVIDLHNRPAYFVSSNMHSLPNLLASYTRLVEDQLVAYLAQTNLEGLYEIYQNLIDEPDASSLENLYYYVLRKFLRTEAGQAHYAKRLAHEHQLGIHHVRRPLNLDVGLQVFELAKLDPAYIDPRVIPAGAAWEKLRRSEAVIVNVDYPLGMAAYHVLSQLSANVGELKGVYIMGKAATLNGRVGDVMIPNVVYDEHSQNTFLFRNCFEADHVAPLLSFGTVLDNQKAVTVRGTFLQNKEFMHLFYQEGYTDIEMEAGPYLNAMYENLHPKRYPVNEIINLSLNLTYDVGILHYASDTPYSKRQSLLSKSLSFFGVDATYATAVAIVRRILEQEI